MALTDNIVAYWKMDGNSNDATGNGHGGTDTNITYGNSYGKINQGASRLASTSGHITVADSAGLDFTSALTLTGWLYAPSGYGGATPAWLAAKTKSATWSSGNGGQWGLYIDSLGSGGTPDRLIGFVNVSGTLRVAVYSSSLSSSAWHHLAMTYDGTTITVYLDGSSVATGSYSGSISTGAYPLYISDNPISDTGSDVYVDEIGVWSRALSSSEITQLYNGGAGLQYPFTIAGGGTNPAFLINFL